MIFSLRPALLLDSILCTWMLFTFRRHLISCHAVYLHISSVNPSAGSFYSECIIIIIIIQSPVDFGSLCVGPVQTL